MNVENTFSGRWLFWGWFKGPVTTHFQARTTLTRTGWRARGRGLWIVLADAAGPPSFSTVTSLGCTSEAWQRRNETKERLCVDWIGLEPNSVHVNKHTNQPNHLLSASFLSQRRVYTYVRAATHAETGEETPPSSGNHIAGLQCVFTLQLIPAVQWRTWQVWNMANWLYLQDI